MVTSNWLSTLLAEVPSTCHARKGSGWVKTLMREASGLAESAGSVAWISPPRSVRARPNAGGYVVLPPSATNPVVQLFEERPGQFIIEVTSENVNGVQAACQGMSFTRLGHTTKTHRPLQVATDVDKLLINQDPAELKALSKGGLAKWY